MVAIGTCRSGFVATHVQKASLETEPLPSLSSSAKTTAASAGSVGQPTCAHAAQNCAGDVPVFCAHTTHNKGLIVECLTQNRNDPSMSTACRTTILEQAVAVASDWRLNYRHVMYRLLMPPEVPSKYGDASVWG